MTAQNGSQPMNTNPTIENQGSAVSVGSDRLFGVIEWISLQGGTFNAFNPGLITGTVRGLTYRYFITEGWIGLKTPDCSPGKAIECRTAEDFQDVLEHYAPSSPNIGNEPRP